MEKGMKKYAVEGEDGLQIVSVLYLTFYRASPSAGEVEAERSTEKLVDLVFVLATKLDINVNDMRALLKNNAKQNFEHFEAINNKQEENLEILTNKIEKLREDNRNQTKKIEMLTDDHENTLLMHNQLQGKGIVSPFIRGFE